MKFYIGHIFTEDPFTLKKKLLGINSPISFFDATKLISKEQLYAALYRTEVAFQTEKQISSNWGIELLLELAGTTKILKAISLFGITKDTKNILIITRNQNFEFEGLISDFPELSPSTKTYELYGARPYQRDDVLILGAFGKHL